MAIGAEWAYLRGIASSPKGSKGWVNALNWGALFLVIIYGMLWGARKFGGIPAELDGGLAWLLTAAHILPIAFLSLAAAMVHRSAVEAEAAEYAEHQAEARERQRRREADEDARDAERRRRLEAQEEDQRQQRLAWELNQQAQDRDLQRKIETARVKAELSNRVKSEAVKGVDNSLSSASESPLQRLPKTARLDTLLTLIGQSGGVDNLDITATAQRFGVSRQTIYNDLEALRSEGRV
jgi:flagellar biosynthesis GTPase FlhF